MKERLANVPVLGWLLRIQERFTEINGTALANGIALQAFLSLFPLILLGIAVIGFIAADDPGFADDVIRDLGLTGDTREQMQEVIDGAENSRGATSGIGVVGLLLSGVNVIVAVQRSVDRAWQTFGKGFMDKVKAIGWLVGAVVIFATSFAASIVLNFLPGILAPLSILIGYGVSVGLFLWTFWSLGRVPVGLRALLPGALFCAVAFEILKIVSSLYLPRALASAGPVYGSFAAVVAALGWLTFFGRIMVYGSVVNVMRWEDDHGTVTIPIEAPRIVDAVALEANRTGAVTDRLEA